MQIDPNVLANNILTALSGHNYLLVASLSLVAAVYGARWLAPKLHNKLGDFVNSDRGGAVTSLVLSVAGGVATTLKAGQPVSFALVSKMLLVAATGSGLFNLSKRISKPSDKASVADKPKTAPPPVPPSTTAFLPLVLISSLLLSSCAHVKAAVIDFGKCELGQVPSAITDILPTVSDVLGGGASWQSDLENLGIKYGEDTITCAVAAVLHQITAAHAEIDANGRVRVVRAQTYLATHKHGR
jgi:hypothetical protein